uniref:Uncharacterized protein n=1 Tax=Micrurus paraensis TaxID=1970185 RepID=A0A2D4KBJ4_9SAUR
MEGGQAIPLLDHAALYLSGVPFTSRVVLALQQGELETKPWTITDLALKAMEVQTAEVLLKVLVFLSLLVANLPSPSSSRVSQLMLGERRVPLERKNPPSFSFLLSC